MGLEITATQRMLPIVVPTAALSGKSCNTNGRLQSAVAGTTADVVAQDSNILEANRWFAVGGPNCVGVGTTALRPTNTPENNIQPTSTYVDTTLGAISVFDGTTWRNPVTGAAV